MEYYIIYGWSDCPFCESAVELLQNTNERHMVVNLDHDDILLEYFKKTYDWPTVPIIIKKQSDESTTTLIGGYTDLCKYLEK
tara:strand:- start:2890 stop:3135 length:246 start_codon:yes stop_codon:yes gene_type:complete